MRQTWFEGWRLFAALTLILIALCIGIAGMRQFEVEGMRMVIRFTARTSLLFFCLAFSAAALARRVRAGSRRAASSRGSGSVGRPKA